jgi:hypothetical protein
MQILIHKRTKKTICVLNNNMVENKRKIVLRKGSSFKGDSCLRRNDEVGGLAQVNGFPSGIS